MKKIVVSVSLVIILLLLGGCLGYKTYQPEKNNAKENNLLAEIEQIEKELEGNNNSASNPALTKENIVEEEIILDLDKNNQTKQKNIESASAGMQVIKVKENNLINLKPKITDPDNDQITFTFSNPLNENGQWQTKYGDAGEYVITLTASDGVLTSVKKVKLVVEKVNLAPVIEELPDLTFNEGEIIKFSPKVLDVNGDKISVTISLPLQNGFFQTDFKSAGEYAITVKASDGELETVKTFNLIIKEVNQPPVLNLAGEMKIKEGETLTLQPETSDADGDKITLTISEPVGNDGSWKTTYTDHGEYFITVIASDGKDQVSQKIKVLVEDVNMPPEIIDVVIETN